jgi:hypothetical protein
MIFTVITIGSMVTANAFAQCCIPSDKKEASVNQSSLQEEGKGIKKS